MAGPYSIGSAHWPGLSKLIEEAGEVQQVCGKILGTGGAVAHWDGSDLRLRLEEEIGDLMAACQFVGAMNGLSASAIEKRVEMKLATFHRWHAGGDPSPATASGEREEATLCHKHILAHPPDEQCPACAEGRETFQAFSKRVGAPLSPVLASVPPPSPAPTGMLVDGFTVGDRGEMVATYSPAKVELVAGRCDCGHLWTFHRNGCLTCDCAESPTQGGKP
jgi:NTP pyrophosphatase (non-canonical NTP hydrolase)